MPFPTGEMVRYQINGVTVTGTVVSQEREVSTGRWLYEIQPDNPAQLTEKMHFSEFEIVPTEVRR